MSNTIDGEQSPLDYHGVHPQRLAIYEPDAGPDPDGNDYFEIVGLIAFLDYSDFGQGDTYIHYMSVRKDHQHHGLARKLLEQLYGGTDGDMDWGKIFSDEAWHLFECFRAEHPNRFHRGKNWS